jgi:hypothetical protein
MNLPDLQAKVDELSLKQEQTGAYKVFDYEHLDLIGSASKSQWEPH